jgi:hypothetical protein
MAATRELVEAYLAGRDGQTVEPVEFTLPPDEPAEEWADYQLPPQSLPQGTAALAALHDVLCPGVEKVIFVPGELPAMDDVMDPALRRAWHRALSWWALLAQVRKLGDYVLPWFVLQLRRLERHLESNCPEAAAPTQHAATHASSLLRLPAQGSAVEDAVGAQQPEGSAAATSSDDPSESGASTPEEHVRQYLDTHQEPRIDEAVQVTGLKEQLIRRTQAWKAHEEKALQDYLLKHPEAKTPDVRNRFGFSPSKTVTMQAWKAHMERKNAAKPVRRIKERPLPDATLKARPDDRLADQCERVDSRDSILRAVLEAADHDMRGQLNRLSNADQGSLLDYLLAHCDILEGGAQGVEQKLVILIEVTRSWLEEREQERRRMSRSGRCS